ncbi:MAG: sulfur carrier protein ThiS [Elusimicrobiota bacterium]
MITINGKKIENPKSLIKILSKKQKGICVLVNGNIVTQKDWKNFKLKDGDKVEIVSFVGGG